MKKYQWLMIVLIIFVAGACKKELPPPDPGDQNGFSNIKASAIFTWETTKPVTLNVVGIQTPYPVFHTLSVALPNGKIILEQNQNITINSVFPLEVPAAVDSLTISYSTMVKTLTIVNGEVNFDYLPPDEVEE